MGNQDNIALELTSISLRRFDISFYIMVSQSSFPIGELSFRKKYQDSKSSGYNMYDAQLQRLSMVYSWDFDFGRRLFTIDVDNPFDSSNRLLEGRLYLHSLKNPAKKKFVKNVQLEKKEINIKR